MKTHNYRILMLLLVCLLLSSCSLEEAKTQEKAVLEVSAETLWSDFKYDRDMAESIYKDKQIIVTGKIAEPPTIFLQQPCILLENGEDSVPDGIFCMFAAGYDIHSYGVGEIISVHGRCTLAAHIAGDASNPYIYIEDACIYGNDTE